MSIFSGGNFYQFLSKGCQLCYHCFFMTFPCESKNWFNKNYCVKKTILFIKIAVTCQPIIWFCVLHLYNPYKYNLLFGHNKGLINWDKHTNRDRPIHRFSNYYTMGPKNQPFFSAWVFFTISEPKVKDLRQCPFTNFPIFLNCYWFIWLWSFENWSKKNFKKRYVKMHFLSLRLL